MHLQAMIPTIHRCQGRQVLDCLSELARLRIEVFREYPYLYAGDEKSEEDYLAGYAEAAGAVLVVARAEGRVVGVSTGMPMEVADEAFRAPFSEAGEMPGDWFYFGESVLLPEFRGMGIGHRFFDERETHAGDLGFRKFAFCSVVRAEDHSLKPADYHPHDAFWTKRGFRIRPELVARLGWRQIDSGGSEQDNRLVFWTREIDR